MNKTLIKKISCFIIPILIISIVLFGILSSEKNNKDNKDNKDKTTPTVSTPKVQEFNDKVVLSDNMLITKAAPSSLHTNVSMCDIAIKGKIINVEPYAMEILSGTKVDEKLSSSGSVPVQHFLKYTLEVEDCYIGSVKNKTIEVFIHGGEETEVTKPAKTGELILFLNERKFGYVVVDFEHGIFHINDDGTLYSYSNTVELSAFDGKKEKDLIAGIKKVAKEEKITTNIK